MTDSPRTTETRSPLARVAGATAIALVNLGVFALLWFREFVGDGNHESRPHDLVFAIEAAATFAPIIIVTTGLLAQKHVRWRWTATASCLSFLLVLAVGPHWLAHF